MNIHIPFGALRPPAGGPGVDSNPSVIRALAWEQKNPLDFWMMQVSQNS
jgi:hypothetical protein